MDAPHRAPDGRFINPWTEKRKHPYLALLKWLLFSKNIYKEEKKRPVNFTVERPDFTSLERTGADYIVWLGHSTVFIKTGGKSILTDPVFRDVNFFVKRKTPFPIAPEGLPPIDFVLISHGHLDHLNTKSVKFLIRHSNPLFIAGPGYEPFFRSAGTSRYMPLDWYEQTAVEGVRITSLPIQHWSKRTFFDTNSMLWCSFLMEGSGKRYYWIGDTGYFDGFRETGERYGPIDVVFAPIGAYEPRWFMKPNHMNPEEALKTAQDVKARVMVPIHWGTFDLTDEPLWLPLEHLKEIYSPAEGFELRILNHGGSFLP